MTKKGKKLQFLAFADVHENKSQILYYFKISLLILAHSQKIRWKTLRFLRRGVVWHEKARWGQFHMVVAKTVGSRVEKTFWNFIKIIHCELHSGELITARITQRRRDTRYAWKEEPRRLDGERNAQREGH